MSKFQRYIEKNWFYILIGFWIASKALDMAYECRGYKAVGGELLVLPVFLLAVEAVRQLVRSISYCMKEE